MTEDRRPEASLEAADVLVGTVVDVAGVAIRLHASDLVRAEAVAALFRHAERSQRDAECALDFIADDAFVPGAAATTTVPSAELWRPEPGLLQIRGDDGLTAWSSATEIVVGGSADSLAREFRHLCLLALTHLLGRHGRCLLHGGAVVTDAGALLVLGNTGTGKSTLVFSAHRLGWSTLSDDVVSVQRRERGVLVQGLPRPIAVPDDVLTEPISGGRLVPEDPRNRTELPAGTLASSTHRVAGVVVTIPGEQPGPIAPLSGHDTMRMVLRASTALGDPDLRPELFAIAGVLARLPAWSIRRGSKPKSALDDVAHQLRSIHRLLKLGRDGTAE